jgi:hypothetical protein
MTVRDTRPQRVPRLSGSRHPPGVTPWHRPSRSRRWSPRRPRARRTCQWAAGRLVAAGPGPPDWLAGPRPGGRPSRVPRGPSATLERLRLASPRWPAQRPPAAPAAPHAAHRSEPRPTGGTARAPGTHRRIQIRAAAATTRPRAHHPTVRRGRGGPAPCRPAVPYVAGRGRPPGHTPVDQPSSPADTPALAAPAAPRSRDTRVRPAPRNQRIRRATANPAAHAPGQHGPGKHLAAAVGPASGPVMHNRPAIPIAAVPDLSEPVSQGRAVPRRTRSRPAVVPTPLGYPSTPTARWHRPR